jgi:predicted nucleic acid-binding Zn ribbon protein
MTEPADAAETREGGFLAPKPDAKPVDHCFRCGVATPAGQGLCDEHNPHHLSGPSSTQMHATIFGGIVLGVIGFFLLAGLVVGTTGPYTAEVITASADPDGLIAISFTVTNEGESEGVADCRVTRDGVLRPEDLAFRTATVAAGESMTFEREISPRPGGVVAYDTAAMSVICT